MSVAIALAKAAKFAAANGKNVVKIISAASAVVQAAQVLKEQAQPLMKDVDAGVLADGLKAGAHGAAAGAGKAGGAVAGAAGEALKKAGGLLAKAGDAKDSLVEALSEAKSAKELEKAIRDARQSVLENATTAIAAADLVKAASKAGGGEIGPLNNMPGCFVAATYKKLDFDKDLTDYVSLYIGRADNMAEGVMHAIGRDGDPDVYADVKYKQNVRIYVYNCLPEEIDALYDSLQKTFGGRPVD